MPKKGGDVELKTTTKTNELQLPMRSVSGGVWPTSWSMEDSVRSGFDKGWKDT
jgi:hypothetical protein